jgi:hypothetical protein
MPAAGSLLPTIMAQTLIGTRRKSHDQPIREIFGTAFCANFVCKLRACRVLRLRGANNPCVGLDLRQ